MILRRGIPGCLIALVLFIGAADVSAQSSSLYQQDLPVQGPAPVDLQQGSWIFRPVPQPRKIELQDVVIVRVDELARMQAEGEMERRKNALYDAVLKDWVSLDGLKAIRPNEQSDGDPRVRGSLQQLFRAESEMETRESLTLNIACRIVDIRPNGNLVLEGHRQIRINDEVWEVSLSGICRRDDVGPDSTVLSRQILDLKLDKRERGHVRDGYKRGWLLRWIDEFHPF
jgi:flagellar L-ring protein precursor FlgH